MHGTVINDKNKIIRLVVGLRFMVLLSKGYDAENASCYNFSWCAA